jgi:pimeloyl-ACP methyl ester carboxylesterase
MKSLLTLALILLSRLAFAAAVDGPQDIAFKATVDGSEQRYVELLPPGFDEDESHDVVLAFHGHGSDRWQFIKDPRGECAGVRDVAARFKAIVVSPDYRAKTSWMGPAAEADTLQIIAELKRRHKIDQVFLAGGSMGGTAVLTFTVLHPELVAGVCSLNGMANLVEYEKYQDARTASFGGTKAEKPDEYRKRSAEFFPEKFTMPVAFTTGGKDELVPPQSVLRLAKIMKEGGLTPLSIHRETGGHSTSYDDTCAAMEFILTSTGAMPLRPAGISATEQRVIAQDLASIEQRLWGADEPFNYGIGHTPRAALYDALLFTKGVRWALRFETKLTPADLALVQKALARGRERSEHERAPIPRWSQRKGKVLRGYLSQVDGSVQPYGVIIPAGYDGTKPMRLDVVLHGSSKPTGLSELRFGSRFDEGDTESKSAPDVDYIELHPLGRVENCYRWAGETDVFEAIEAVCRNYNIDRDRIVLRGMSMGASGTWHLGLKHPDRFVAIGPYCGYVDTHRFSETPMPGFIKVGPLPAIQELGLHMLDSVDYAANAGVVPAIAAIGDKDVFFQAHVIMGEAFKREGLEMVNLISPGTGHTIDPVTHKEQMRRIGEYAARGLDHAPKQLRFVTWTLKYNRCHWLEVLALGRHYERAEFSATTAADGALEIAEPTNITRFAIHPPLSETAAKIRIAGREIAPPDGRPGRGALYFEKTPAGWTCDDARDPAPLTGKRPGLQGPIDDAFSAPFLCVRGTGAPWNSEVAAWAEASLRRFAYEWAKYMRGDLQIKADTEVNDYDVATKHLILFGDPGNNSWIAKALPKLPLTWTRDEVTLGGEKRSAKDHAPVLICASPLPGAGEHYLGLNSGHTFHEKEFAAFNYLLFPRLGDWSVMQVLPGAEAWQPTSPAFPEETVRAGYFDETWAKPVTPIP